MRSSVWIMCPFSFAFAPATAMTVIAILYNETAFLAPQAMVVTICNRALQLYSYTYFYTVVVNQILIDSCLQKTLQYTHAHHTYMSETPPLGTGSRACFTGDMPMYMQFFGNCVNSQRCMYCTRKGCMLIEGVQFYSCVLYNICI